MSTPESTVTEESITSTKAMADAPASASRDLFSPSDVILSPRFEGSFSNQDWQAAFNAFSATRIAWTYSRLQSSQAKRAYDQAPFSGSLESWVPTVSALQTYFSISESAAAQMRQNMLCLNQSGQELYVPGTVVDYRNMPNRASPEWRQYVIARAKDLVTKDVTSFQQDMALLPLSMNKNGGCYMNGQKVDPVLAVQGFFDSVRTGLQSYADQLHLGRRILLSGNMPTYLDYESLDWAHAHLDYYISEHIPEFGNMGNSRMGLINYARFARGANGVSALTVESTNLDYILRGTQAAYALGLTAIVPWDVYISTTEPRYFGAPADSARLFRFIRDHHGVFDDYQPQEEGDTVTENVASGMGYVTAVTPKGSETAINWSRQSEFKTIAKGHSVFINGVPFTTVSNTINGTVHLSASAVVKVGDTVSWIPNPSIVSVARHRASKNDRVVHYVNFDDQARLITLRLKKSAFPAVLKKMIRSDGVTRSISPIDVGDAYVYPGLNVPRSGWFILGNSGI